MSDPLASVVASSEGNVVRFLMSGEIDLTNAEQLGDEIAGTIGNDATQAFLDLTSVAYIDSVGVRMLFRLANRLRTAQIDLVIIAPEASPARRVLEIAGLTSQVAIQPD